MLLNRKDLMGLELSNIESEILNPVIKAKPLLLDFPCSVCGEKLWKTFRLKDGRLEHVCQNCFTAFY